MTNQMVPIGKLFDIEKGDLQSTKCTPGEYDFITAAEGWKKHNEYSHECEALIFAAAASGSLGRTHYVDGKFTTSDLCYILTPKDEVKYPVNLSFYHFVFNSLRPTLVTATKSGTSKESINQSNFKNYEIPYFNIELQDFWIGKLQSTLGLRDLLGAELTHQKNLLKKLRQQILQEAIEGKLTAEWRAQNPDVETASELLKRIAIEKEHLVHAKKIKAQKSLPPISDEEARWDLPHRWERCRLQEITKLITDGKHGDCQDLSDSGYYFLSAKDIQNGQLVYVNSRQIAPAEFQEVHNRTNLEPGDICMVNTGATVGKLAIAKDYYLTERTTFQKSVAVIKVFRPFVDEEFVGLFLKCETANLLAASWGSAINNLLLGDLKRQVVMLPPHLEQKVIVEKVGKLLGLCDQLETQISQNQIHAEQLLSAALKEAFSHNSTSTPEASNPQEAACA